MPGWLDLVLLKVKMVYQIEDGGHTLRVAVDDNNPEPRPTDLKTSPGW
jgi:hypothetical protein